MSTLVVHTSVDISDIENDLAHAAHRVSSAGLLARHEVLMHVMESALRVSNDAPTSPVPQSGVARLCTPDAKVAKKRVVKDECLPAKKRAAATRMPAAPPEPTKEVVCQVCLKDQSKWDGAQPCLLNAHGKAVKIPGAFCSPACYQHV